MNEWTEFHRENVGGFDIVTSAAPEECSPEGQFDDDGETVAAIRSGEFEWFVVKVEARREGITLGESYLGCCCYRSLRDFVNLADDYYSDMREEAISEARATIAKLCA